MMMTMMAAPFPFRLSLTLGWFEQSRLQEVWLEYCMNRWRKHAGIKGLLAMSEFLRLELYAL